MATKTVADYPDAVDRIVEAEVPAGATTRGEVLAVLRSSSAPQIDRQVAEGVAGSVLTEEEVIEAIGSSGELPSRGEIPAISRAADDYDHDDRQATVAEAVDERVATVEDVTEAVDQLRADAQARNAIPTREDVGNAVGQAGEIVGAGEGEVIDQQAERINAPTEDQLRAARAEAAGRVVEDGQARTADGRFIGDIQNVEQVPREDGLYFRNRRTGTVGRAAEWSL